MAAPGRDHESNRRGVLGTQNFDLLKIDVKTGKCAPELPKGPKTNVQWSPDGKHLAGRDGMARMAPTPPES